MRVKKYAAIAASIFLMLIFTAAHAAVPDKTDNVAYYSVVGTYNQDTETYTAEIYLITNEFLAAGTFGIAYDVTLRPEFELDTKYFTSDIGEPAFLSGYDISNASYIVFNWFLNADEKRTGEIHLGTITVTDVKANAYGVPDGWKADTFRQLDWRDTPMYSSTKYSDDEYDLSLNGEIWRTLDDDEKDALKTMIIDAEEDELSGFYKVLKSQVVEEVGIGEQGSTTEATLTVPVGFYQGQAFDRFNDEYNNDQDLWVDIGFVFTSDPPLEERDGITISGTIQGFNPNKPITITVLDSETGEPVEGMDPVEIGTDEAPYISVADSGMVVAAYEIEVDPGKYKLKIEKDTHLTYITDVIEVEEDQTIVPGGHVVLYCGDIVYDEKIKLDDRSILWNTMNNQLLEGDLTDTLGDIVTLIRRSDLNGDGKINLRDWDIFKLYYNKSYDGG